MAEQSASGYMCLATMDVAADQADLYDQLLCEAASIFKTHDWRLLVSGQKAAGATAGASCSVRLRLSDSLPHPPGETVGRGDHSATRLGNRRAAGEARGRGRGRVLENSALASE